jgi:hypothetical protein
LSVAGCQAGLLGFRIPTDVIELTSRRPSFVCLSPY